MIACFGYGAQATITREGPFQNLMDHLADPVHNNILTNFGERLDRSGRVKVDAVVLDCLLCKLFRG